LLSVLHPNLDMAKRPKNDFSMEKTLLEEAKKDGRSISCSSVIKGQVLK